MRLLFAGTPAAAVPSLLALLEAGHDVATVVTNPDAPTGRGRVMAGSPVAAEARARGIEVLQPARAREDWFVDAVTHLEPDVAVVVAWGCLVPDRLLTVPTHGWINLHFSLLPAWRGAAPVQRAIMAGEQTTGVTTFELVHELDAGPIYRQEPVPIDPDETAGELLQRLAVLGASALVETLTDVAAGAVPQPQPDGDVSLAPKLGPTDGHIDWAMSAAAIHDLIRGVTPAPGAWTTLEGERLKVGRTQLLDANELVATGAVDLEPGELLATRHELLAGTGAGGLRLTQVQPSGKPMMDGSGWARGARLRPGARYE